MKRGATVLNYVLIIGMLFVAMIVLLNLQKIALFQSKQVEIDASTTFADDLRQIIEKSEAYPSDMNTTIKLPYIRQYTLTIANSRIDLEFPGEKVSLSEAFATSNQNIIPNTFRNSGITTIATKARNLLVTDKITCNITDSHCDPGCVIQQICDPACYSPYLSDVCNPYCVDSSQDDITNQFDADALCDPDCYNNYRNGGYYDIDCIESNDTICDPDTDNIADGICDADCKPPNQICDPDCGTADPDCPYRINDNVCETQKGENCLLGEDCDCGKEAACKIGCTVTVDEKGCIDNSALNQKHEQCTLSCECNSLQCKTSLNNPSIKACCAQDEYYNSRTGRCAPLIGDGLCFQFGAYQETCETSPDDCCECGGTGNAFLHIDLWPYWANPRFPNDAPDGATDYPSGEFWKKALWRCESFGVCTGIKEQPMSLAQIQNHYNSLLNYFSHKNGGCSHGGSNDIECYQNFCMDPPYDLPQEECNLNFLDYDALYVRGGRYSATFGDDGAIWGTTVKVYDGTTLLTCISSHPGNENANACPANFGQGSVNEPGYAGCIAIPPNSPIKVTMRISTRENIEKELTITAEPGTHYVWNITGLHKIPLVCDVPPDIAAQLRPGLSCQTLKTVTPITDPSQI